MVTILNENNSWHVYIHDWNEEFVARIAVSIGEFRKLMYNHYQLTLSTKLFFKRGHASADDSSRVRDHASMETMLNLFFFHSMTQYDFLAFFSVASNPLIAKNVVSPNTYSRNLLQWFYCQWVIGTLHIQIKRIVRKKKQLNKLQSIRTN